MGPAAGVRRGFVWGFRMGGGSPCRGPAAGVWQPLRRPTRRRSSRGVFVAGRPKGVGDALRRGIRMPRMVGARCVKNRHPPRGARPGPARPRRSGPPPEGEPARAPWRRAAGGPFRSVGGRCDRFGRTGRREAPAPANAGRSGGATAGSRRGRRSRSRPRAGASRGAASRRRGRRRRRWDGRGRQRRRRAAGQHGKPLRQVRLRRPWTSSREAPAPANAGRSGGVTAGSRRGWRRPFRR